eukprot:3160196-Rhodomonas_salina.2
MYAATRSERGGGSKGGGSESEGGKEARGGPVGSYAMPTPSPVLTYSIRLRPVLCAAESSTDLEYAPTSSTDVERRMMGKGLAALKGAMKEVVDPVTEVSTRPRINGI